MLLAKLFKDLLNQYEPAAQIETDIEKRPKFIMKALEHFYVDEYTYNVNKQFKMMLKYRIKNMFANFGKTIKSK